MNAGGNYKMTKGRMKIKYLLKINIVKLNSMNIRQRDLKWAQRLKLEYN